MTDAVFGKTVTPTMSARPTVIVCAVRKRTPDGVLTMLPPGMVFDDVKSRLRNRTVPVAAVSSTRFPVAGNVSVAVTSTSIRSAGTTPLTGSGVDAGGSATMVIGIGPTASSFGVTTIVAEGRNR